MPGTIECTDLSWVEFADDDPETHGKARRWCTRIRNVASRSKGEHKSSAQPCMAQTPCPLGIPAVILMALSCGCDYPSCARHRGAAEELIAAAEAALGHIYCKACGTEDITVTWLPLPPRG